MHALDDKEFGRRAKQDDAAFCGGPHPSSLTEDETFTHDARIRSLLARRRPCRFPVVDALVAAVAGLDKLHHRAVHPSVHRIPMALCLAVLREGDLGRHE